MQGENENHAGILRALIGEAKKIVFLGGAGVSTESGIPDFRGNGGLYTERAEIPPETILSRSFFFAHTEDFYRFYRSKMLFPGAKPNRAHEALAELEKRGKLTAVITQNIDGLHQAAGSVNVIELHGSVLRNTCTGCRAKYPLSLIEASEGIPRCPLCRGVVKPDVVLYEEPLDGEDIDRAIFALESADLLIVGGTSLTVNPAASLVSYFSNGPFVILNKTPTPYDRYADFIFREPIGELLGKAVFGQ